MLKRFLMVGIVAAAAAMSGGCAHKYIPKLSPYSDGRDVTIEVVVDGNTVASQSGSVNEVNTYFRKHGVKIPMKFDHLVSAKVTSGGNTHSLPTTKVSGFWIPSVKYQLQSDTGSPTGLLICFHRKWI